MPIVFGLAGIFHRAGGGEFGHPGDQRHAATDSFDGTLQHGQLFIALQRIVLAAGAQDDKAIDTIVDQRGLHLLGGIVIDVKALRELGGGGGVNALPKCLGML